MNKFEIKDIKDKGQGLFTTGPFIANEVILRCDGNKIKLSEVKNNSYPNDLLQIGSESFVDMMGQNHFFINHSCRPNCYVKMAVGNAFLLSLRPIDANEELTFDYSLTSTDTPETWQMKCNCGNFACRKIISGFNSLPDNLKKEYLSLGIVPDYNQ